MDLYGVYLSQPKKVYYLKAGIVALAVTAGDELTPVAVDYVLAFLDRELGEGFEFR